MAQPAGKRRSVFLLQRPVEGFDAWGHPLPGWEDVVQFRGGPRSDSGLAAIRGGLSSGLPVSIARYSVEVETKLVEFHQITSAHRLVLYPDNTLLSINGVIRDLADGRRSFILCEVGGHEG